MTSRNAVAGVTRSTVIARNRINVNAGPAIPANCVTNVSFTRAVSMVTVLNLGNVFATVIGAGSFAIKILITAVLISLVLMVAYVIILHPINTNVTARKAMMVTIVKSVSHFSSSFFPPKRQRIPYGARTCTYLHVLARALSGRDLPFEKPDICGCSTGSHLGGEIIYHDPCGSMSKVNRLTNQKFTRSCD